MKLYLLFVSLFLNCVNLDELKNAEPIHYLSGLIIASARGTQTSNSDQASFQIQGTLKDSSGNPIANATLTLGVSQNIVSREAVTTSTRTDANGNYTLNLKLGNFSVKVTNSSGLEIGSFRMNATSTTTKPEISVTSGNMSLVVSTVTAPSPISLVTVAPSNLSYSSNTLNLTVGTAMTSISPTVTGTVTSYSVSPALPSGLSLNSSTGVISGTPTSVQSAISYVITASNTGGNSTFLIQLIILPLAPNNFNYSSSLLILNINSPMIPLTPSVTGKVDSYSIINSNSPLPSGLILDSLTGVISGTPTTAQSVSSYIISANNSGGSKSFTLQILVSPPSINRNWTTFTDMMDGTIRLDVKSGTFGGRSYSSKIIYFAKCSHGQIYDQVSNNCLGSPTKIPFCNSNNNLCNNNNSTLEISSGPLYDACNILNSDSSKLGGKTGWRVPSYLELKLLINCPSTEELPNDQNSCSNYISPTINNLFPNSQSDYYWSSSTYIHYTAQNGEYAWDIDFRNGTSTASLKGDNSNVRCITDK